MAEYSQTYWNNLLEQFRNGSISDIDRFELEKQALDDPFLFDALEGFSLYENVAEEKKEEKSKTKIFNLPYIAVAASVIFLGIAIFNFLPNINNNSMPESDKGIAMVLEDEKETETLGNTSEISSTSQDDQQPIHTESASNETVKPVKAKASKKSSVNENSKNENKAVDKRQNESQFAKPAKPSTPIPSNSEVAVVNEGGKVNVEELMEPSGDSNTTKFEDIDVSKDMEAAEDVADLNLDAEELEEVAVMEEEISVEEEGKEINDIALKQESKGMPEENKKKKSADSSNVVYEAVPVIGKETFDDYAKTRIDERGLRQEEPLEVTVEFTIDENGNVSNFHHIFSGCAECGPFASALLQNSGEWKTIPPGFSGKARYVFIF